MQFDDTAERAAAAAPQPSDSNRQQAIILDQGQPTTGHIGASNLARRRYQKGFLFLRGKREKLWIGRWMEDDLLPDGRVHRRRKSEVLGSIKDFPTKRLAQRELDRRLSVVNSPTYQARPTALFRDFAERWRASVLPNHRPSTQASEKSDLKAWSAEMGDVAMKDITAERIQSIVTKWRATKNPKTVKNRVATLRVVWNSAKAWKYVSHDPFEGLALADWDKSDPPFFSIADVKRIIANAKPPYDVLFRLVWETGIRRGEVCALNVENVDLDNLIIVVRRSRWNRHVTSTKSKRPRVFSISPGLAGGLRGCVDDRSPDTPLFLSKQGKRLHPDNFVKRHLKPILKKLGLAGGLHAFRHGNATAMDAVNAPVKVRQERLGHVALATTLGYTHLVGADDRRVSAELGAMLDQEFLTQDCPKLPPKAVRASEGDSEAAL